jgi:DNA-binding XRE family transcriptional regulator
VPRESASNSPIGARFALSVRESTSRSSQFFRGARQDADLTQEDAGDLLGWSPDVVVNFENDKRDFGVADLILFAQKIKMDPVVLLARIVAHVRGK